MAKRNTNPGIGESTDSGVIVQIRRIIYTCSKGIIYTL